MEVHHRHTHTHMHTRTHISHLIFLHFPVIDNLYLTVACRCWWLAFNPFTRHVAFRCRRLPASLTRVANAILPHARVPAPAPPPGCGSGTHAADAAVPRRRGGRRGHRRHPHRHTAPPRQRDPARQPPAPAPARPRHGPCTTYQYLSLRQYQWQGASTALFRV
jgi:hypothetical protein